MTMAVILNVYLKTSLSRELDSGYNIKHIYNFSTFPKYSGNPKTFFIEE